MDVASNKEFSMLHTPHTKTLLAEEQKIRSHLKMYNELLDVACYLLFLEKLETKLSEFHLDEHKVNKERFIFLYTCLYGFTDKLYDPLKFDELLAHFQARRQQTLELSQKTEETSLFLRT